MKFNNYIKINNIYYFFHIYIFQIENLKYKKIILNQKKKKNGRK